MITIRKEDFDEQYKPFCTSPKIIKLFKKRESSVEPAAAIMPACLRILNVKPVGHSKRNTLFSPRVKTARMVENFE